MLTRPRFGPGVRIVHSAHAPESVAGPLTEHDLETLDLVQILTDMEVSNPEAEAIDLLPPYGSYWRYRLTLWRNVGRVRWLLLLQELDAGLHVNQTVITCDDPISAIAAFERELVHRLRSSQQYTVTRPPWAIVHAAIRKRSTPP